MAMILIEFLVRYIDTRQLRSRHFFNQDIIFSDTVTQSINAEKWTLIILLSLFFLGKPRCEAICNNKSVFRDHFNENLITAQTTTLLVLSEF